MISSISGILLKEEPCYKFMLKHEIKNYFRQFTKTLSICLPVKYNTHTLVMRNYFWLEKLNVCAKY